MYKRLLLLFGCAITGVIFNHVIGWLMANSSLWAGPNPIVLAPGTVSAHGMYIGLLVVIKKLATFCVPAFLFASGFFAAFSGRKSGTEAQVRMTLNRVLALAVPYLIWSIIFIVINPLGQDLEPGKTALRLLYGGIAPEYYFVPLLIQFTILAPLVVNWARERSSALLLVSGLIQLGVAALTYLNIVYPIPFIAHILDIKRNWSVFPTWAFFFAFGMVVGFHQPQYQKFITRYRYLLLAGMILFGILSVAESEFLLGRFGVNWRDSGVTIPTSIYALCTIAVFLAFDFTRLTVSRPFFFLSNKTYSIYLIHPLVVTVVMNFIADQIPQFLNFPYLLLIFMVIVGIGGPVLLLVLGRRLFGATVYKYMFG